MRCRDAPARRPRFARVLACRRCSLADQPGPPAGLDRRAPRAGDVIEVLPPPYRRRLVRIRALTRTGRGRRGRSAGPARTRRQRPKRRGRTLPLAALRHRARRRPDEAETSLRRHRVSVVGLSLAPATSHPCTTSSSSRDQAGDLAWQVNATGLRHPLPGARVAPRLSHRRQPGLELSRQPSGSRAASPLGADRLSGGNFLVAAQVNARARPPMWSTRSPRVYAGQGVGSASWSSETPRRSPATRSAAGPRSGSSLS